MDRLDKTSAAFGMEISAEKTKLMTNNTSGISIDIRINGEKLDEVDSFKYLGAVVTDQGSKFGHFTLLFCRERQRNVTKCKMHVY